jgi:hypothetical protein
MKKPMMGILCTEQSCRSCKCCGIISDPFHSADGKLLSLGSFYGVHGSLVLLINYIVCNKVVLDYKIMCFC